MKSDEIRKRKNVDMTDLIEAEQEFIKYLESKTYTNVPEYPFGLGEEWEK